MVFISEELEFKLDPNLANYILPKGSFFSELKDFSLRDRQDILERYPPPRNLPRHVPESEASWKQIMNVGAKAREKELHNIAQQLLEISFPLSHLADFLQQSFPSGSRDWGFIVKDIFLFAALQTYITNLRRENVVRATAGPTAVSIMQKRKADETLMGDATEAALKSWSKTQEAVKKYKVQHQPFPQRGDFQGRGQFFQFSHSSKSSQFAKPFPKKWKGPPRGVQEK